MAIPGELKGYWYAHQKYGKLPWSELVKPTIDLCMNGHLITPFLAGLLKRQEQKLLNSPTLRFEYKKYFFSMENNILNILEKFTLIPAPTKLTGKVTV